MFRGVTTTDRPRPVSYKADHLPIDVHHNIERAELWAILVLGESMLSLVHGSAQYIKYVRAAGRSMPPQWRPMRFPLAPRACAPRGCIVRVASLTKPREIPTCPEYIWKQPCLRSDVAFANACDFTKYITARVCEQANAEFYLVIAIAFTINFVLLKIYINSTPEPSSHDHRVPDLDTHAIDLSLIRSVFFDISQGVVTAFLFIFGVAIKFVVKYGHYKDGSYYAQDYAEMFSIGAGFSLLTMTLSRLTHEWTDYPVYAHEKE